MTTGISRKLGLQGLMTLLIFLFLAVATQQIEINRAISFGLGGAAIFWLAMRIGIIRRN